MSPAHSHAPVEGADEDVAPHVVRLLRLSVAVAAVAVVVGAIFLWPGDRSGGADPLGLDSDPVNAQVAAAIEGPCSADPSARCVSIGFVIEDGPQAGDTGVIEQQAPTPIGVGDGIEIIVAETPEGEPIYSFYDFDRDTSLIVLAVLFAASVLILGRWRGLGALAGLSLSLFVIVWFALPSLVDGNNAVAVALVTSGAVAILALYLAHGAGAATDVAVVSTLASLALTGILAWIFVGASKLTGFTDDPTFVLRALGNEIDPRGILLAGIVIGSLGVLDDVTVTQVSAVWELHRHSPDAGRRELFTSALRIGRDHISSTVNTLVLAYAGATLPLLLLFSAIGQPASEVASREVVATEIIRALVGSIGLVAAVPISTGLAIQVVTSGRGERR